jgi:hypothetical protein
MELKPLTTTTIGQGAPEGIVARLWRVTLPPRISSGLLAVAHGARKGLKACTFHLAAALFCRPLMRGVSRRVDRERHDRAAPSCCFRRTWTGEGIVALIMIRCPAKGSAVSTGIEVVGVEQLPAVTATMACSACGGVHHWTKNEAWLSADGEQYRKAFAA